MANPTQQQLDQTYAQDEALGIPRGFTARQIAKESSWNAHAESPKGARGYVQVIPKTLDSISEKLGRSLDPSNFQDALDIHKYAMGENLRHFGNLPDATRAYNSGWNRAKWDNPETNDYVAHMTGGDDIQSRTTAPRPRKEAKLPPIAQAEALRAARGATKSEADELSAQSVGIDSPLNNTEPSAVEKQDAAEMAGKTHWAGAGETAADTYYWGTLTGRLQEWATRGEAVDGWKMNDGQSTRLVQDYPQLYNNDEARKYVQAAVSDTDYEHRLSMASEHVELGGRSANTGGLQGVANGAVGLAMGIADPAMWVATMGLGAGLNTVRAAAGMGRAGLVAASAEGAIGNAGFDYALRQTTGQDMDSAGLVQQAMFGAAFGAMGHLAFGHGHADDAGPTADPSEHGTRAAIESRTHETLNNPVEPKPPGEHDGTISNNLSDVEAHNPTGISAEDMHTVEPEMHTVAPEHVTEGEHATGEHVTEEGHATTEPVHETATEIHGEEHTVVEEHTATHEPTEPVHEEAVTEPTTDPVTGEPVPHLNVSAVRGSLDGVPKRGLQSVLTSIMKNGDDLEKGLAGRLMEALSGADVGVRHSPKLKNLGHYDPATHSITMRDLGDHTTVLHEAAHALTVMKVHYGKLNPNSAHGKIVAELDALRQQARDLYKGKDHDAIYFTKNVDEFIAGLYSGKGEFINHLASFEGGKSVVTKLFDAVRRLLGVEAKDTSALARAMGLSDELMMQKLNTTVNRGDGRSFSLRQRVDGNASPESAIHEFKQTAAEAAWTKAIGDHTEVRGPASVNAGKYYNSETRGKLLNNVVTGSVIKLFDSVGLTIGMSKSKGARMVGSMLAEDASGLNRQHGMSAALDTERLKHGFRNPFMEAYEHNVNALMSQKEIVLKTLGQSGSAEARIGRTVAEYRLAKRQARLNDVEFNAGTYHPAVQAIGNNLDAFWGHIHEASKAAGETVGTAIGGKGFQGHMPYRWLWSDIHRASVESPEKFNALVGNFQKQYLAKVLNPAIEGALSHGPLPEGAIQELTSMMHDKAGALTENYIKKVMQSPEARNVYDENHIAKITEDLLKNDFRGQKITNEVVANVKRKLNEIVTSRERTEFDLMTPHNGTRLLDFMDTDIGRMVDSNAQRFAGNISMARRGLGSPMQIEAMRNALVKDGASPKDLDNIDFLIRSLNGNLNPDEAGAAKIFRQMAYSSMMGKLGFNALADTAGTASAVGIAGMFRVLGRGFMKDTALVKSIADFSPGTIAHDQRMFNQTVDHNVSDQSLTSEGSKLSNFAQKASDFVSTISGLKHVSKMLHNGFIPVFAEDLIKTIQSGKGMSAARLGDLGLTPERIEHIRSQFEAHNPSRKKGEAVDWANWDQLAADDFLGAVQRGTGQALQRIYVGETPRWTTETAFGRSMAQFKAFGWVAAEKQSGRNFFIRDSNSYASFAVGLPMAAMMYRAKLETSMIGMDEAEKNKKLAEAYEKDHGLQSFTGLLTMFNMSGMGADFADLASLTMIGQSHGSSSPMASLGYLSNLKNGVSGIAGYATGTLNGEDSVKTQKSLYKAWRMVPGGNSVFGTAVMNATKPQ